MFVSCIEFDPGGLFILGIPSVLIVLALVFGTGAIMYKCRKRQAGIDVYQTLVVCELLDLDRPGKMLIKDALPHEGSTTDELFYFNNSFYLYLKPKVRLIQKANSDSGGFRVSCLVTGFYPRHINLTLFRDEQPVADHEITGGDLLPNDDGTYQMRKSLEISATDKHKYICSATHLDHQVTSESDSSEPFKSVILSVLIVLALVLVFGAGAILYKCKKKRTVKPKVMLLQQKSQSSRFRVTCLTTGFYPRHINLTLFRDGQPVAVHEITGGDLLPNGDGTYQMRKSL
ncbi:major histocompatibility complex class I-related gene protein-like [Labeo rohita]|uniref:Major histocompatibility complex class I-related gene protein-like n=1 Tax=Labeo rohita TaxID=84645 RepID=A0A498NZP4_LABRO|nr:major histocompatibility complex class I-related gene protein-like [Labeo rohita]